MKEETKSNIKTAVIAILVTAAIFFGLSKMDNANTAAHSHNGGPLHTD